jgi:3-oxoacyl-[acyl-carrier protein] reductase
MSRRVGQDPGQFSMQDPVAPAYPEDPEAGMDLGIQGRVAMVAAGSKGLGRAAALALAKEGCAVSLCGRGAEALAATRAELEALGVRALAEVADVSNPDDLARWHRKTEASLGPVDILITNTGGPKAAVFADLSDSDWAAGVESTLMNVVRMSRLVLPGMRARRWGRIVHITSLVAKQPYPLLTISSTLRAGLSALTRTLALETAKDGITVNALLPGHVMTDRQTHLAEVKSRAEGITMAEHFTRQAAAIPAGRIGEPAEVGAVIAFLCSAQASYLTGQSLLVDGGLVQGTF